MCSTILGILIDTSGSIDLLELKIKVACTTTYGKNESKETGQIETGSISGRELI
jgi:hypothetical protein